MNNISYPNQYQGNKRSVTPNPIHRAPFRDPNNINIQTQKRGPAIQIQKKTKPSIKIETSGGGSAIITDKRNYNLNDMQNKQNPTVSLPQDRQFAPVQQQIMPFIDPEQMNTSINQNPQFVNKPSAFFGQALHQAPIITPPSQPTTTTSPPIPSADAFNRLSLLSFVSTFEDEKSFNETDLEVLGLDLKCQEPLLPMLHSVLSNAPLLDHSKYPTPESYSSVNQPGNPIEKVALFPPATLLFIFYTCPHDPLQVQAAQELLRRQWTYDDENEEWRDPDGNPWSISQWKKTEENQEGEIV